MTVYRHVLTYMYFFDSRSRIMDLHRPVKLQFVFAKAVHHKLVQLNTTSLKLRLLTNISHSVRSFILENISSHTYVFQYVKQ